MANVEPFPVAIVKINPVTLESIDHHLDGVHPAAKHMKFVIWDGPAIGRFEIRLN